MPVDERVGHRPRIGSRRWCAHYAKSMTRDHHGRRPVAAPTPAGSVAAGASGAPAGGLRAFAALSLVRPSLARRSPARPALARPSLAVALVLAGLIVLVAAPRPAGAVIAGVRVAPSDHPAVVRLADVCTATVIAPRRLLTAGHCVSHVVPGTTRVTIGGRRVRVSRVARHPRFQYLTPDYPAEPYRDLALVELAEDAGVEPLAVARRAVGAGTVVTLIGYGTGRPKATGNYGVLRTAALVVRDGAACRRGLRRAARGQAQQYRHRVMLCTQDPDGVRPFASGCYGDSGAPLLRGGLDADPEVVGVDSWGVACGARDGDPEVFARVSAERAFITAPDPGWTTQPIEEPFTTGRL